MSEVKKLIIKASNKSREVARRMASIAVKKRPLTDSEFLLRLEVGDDIQSPDFSHIAGKVNQSVVCRIDGSRLVSEMRTVYQEDCARILAEADSVLNNTFAVLGFPPHRFSGRIEWSTDFVSGKSWPNDYYVSVPIVRWNDKSDIKVPWELSRGHYLVTLAQAWFLTRKQSYAAKFANIIEGWNRSNPYLRGPNWTCPMEAAIRMVNWVAAVEILSGCETLSQRFRFDLYRSIYQHAVFIEENLEFVTRGMNTNHYLSDLMGLLLAGSIFECPSARIWRDYAVTELEREIQIQILPDGFCYESSLNYHQLTLEILLICYAIGEGGKTFSAKFKRQLERMVALIHSLQKPDGSLPNMGDGDSGRILVLDAQARQNPGRLRELGADLLGRTDLMRSDRLPMESRWLSFGQSINSSDSNRAERSAERASVACADSGLAVLRSGDLYLFLAANNVGTGGLGNHKHNDLLSIEISDGDTNYIVDSGTYTYTADPQARNRFRSTASHSVPSIRGEELNRFLPRLLFAVRKDGIVRITRWETYDDQEYLEAEHTAYERLFDPVVVSRAIYFDKNNRVFAILDRFNGTTGSYTLDNTLVIRDAAITERRDDIILHSTERIGKNLLIRPITPGWTRAIVEHEISQEYGSKRAAKKIVYSANMKMPSHMLWAAIADGGERQESELTQILGTVLHRNGWNRFAQPASQSHIETDMVRT